MRTARSIAGARRSWITFLAAAVLLGAGAELQAGTVELALSRVSTAGWSDSAGGGEGSPPAISADGRFVAFTSSAENLAPGQDDRNHRGFDVFLFDRTAGTVTLVSRAAAAPGQTGNGSSRQPTISADGRFVAFESGATDLVAGLTVTPDPEEDPAQNVFLFDRTTGLVTLVSRASSSASATAERPCAKSRLSADGRYVTYASEAGNLVAGMATSFWNNVFLYDRVSGQTVLVSHAAGGGQTGLASDSPAISADGRYVAYRSEARILVPGQETPSFEGNVFLYDRVTGANVLASHTPASPAEGVNAAARSPSISADGRFVAFSSRATDLVAGASDTNFQDDVFLFDRTTGAVTLASHAASTPLTAANGASTLPLVSADGSTVVFLSTATQLAAGQVDSGSSNDVFAYDRATGATALVSHTAASPATASGQTAPGPFFTVSADGRYVAFVDAGILVAGQVESNGFNGDDVFLYDRTTGGTVLVSHLPGSAVSTGFGPSGVPVLAADGSALAFGNQGFDLVANDLQLYDYFLYDRAAATNRLVSRRDSNLPSVTPGQGSRPSSSRALSADGRYLLLASESRDILPGQIEDLASTDLFLLDRVTRSTTLVTHLPGAPTSAGGGIAGSLSADGRYAAFLGYATNLIAGQVDSNGGPDVFFWDRASGAITLVSHAAGAPSTAANGISNEATISADGRFVVFTSRATDLVPGQADGNLGGDIFLWDRTTGSSQLVSRSTAGALTTGDRDSKGAIPSADGRYVAFLSRAADLVPGQVGDPQAFTSWDAFLFDRLTGNLALVSHSTTSFVTAAGIDSEQAAPIALSADGRFVALVSRSSALVSGAPPSSNDKVFLYARDGGQVRLVSHRAGAPTEAGTGDSRQPVLSADGRFVAFTSFASDLVAGQVDDDGSFDVFVYDQASDQTRLVSHRPGAPTATGNQFSSALIPEISADGRFVAFASEAPGLVAGQSDLPSTWDLFLYDRNTGATELVSRSRLSPLTAGSGDSFPFSPMGNGDTLPFALAADGATVAFVSQASDLVSGDFNFASDAFLYRRSTAPGRYFTLPPCRVEDTRTAGQGPVASGAAEAWPIYAACGIPSTARAVSVNLTVVAPSGAGFLTLFAGDQPLPATSTINFRAGQVRANNAVVPLAAGGDGTLGVFTSIAGNGTVHVVLDVNGYFE